jgi:pRiA4b ORF-3-like protein
MCPPSRRHSLRRGSREPACTLASTTAEYASKPFRPLPNVRLCSVSPPAIHRLVIAEQASLAQLHEALQVAFGWSGEHQFLNPTVVR